MSVARLELVAFILLMIFVAASQINVWNFGKVPSNLLKLFQSLAVSQSKPQGSWDYFLSNHYKEAIDAFEKELISERTPESLYGLSLAYLRYGQLNAKLYQQAILLEYRYYKLLRVLKGEGVKHSNYVPFYLGVIELRLGKYEDAMTNFSDVIRNPKVDSIYKAYAKLLLGECYWGKRDLNKAKELWKEVESSIGSNKLLGSELAVVYTEYGIKAPQMFELCREYIKTGSPTLHADRFWHNIGWVYYKNGRVKEALEFFSKIDMTTPELIDRVYEEKTIRFYVPGYFKHWAAICFANSTLILEELNQQARINFNRPLVRRRDYKSDVLYSLAICYMETGRLDEAMMVLKQLNGEPHAKVLLARVYYQKAQVDNAKSTLRSAEAVLDKMNDGSAEKHALMIDLAYTHAMLGIERVKAQRYLAELRYQNLTDSKFPPYDAMPLSEKYRRIGVSYLNMGEFDMAMEVLEKGHNKMGKNTISDLRHGNEPLLLVDLAFAFYSIGFNFYDQPTETYLVIQKYYPIVRQLHNAMQGIFALWPHVTDDVKDMLICEKYPLLFG